MISHPTAERMHIIPTSRDSRSNLALSSRNAYLLPEEMKVAPILYQALSAAKLTYNSDGKVTGEELVSAAMAVVEEKRGELRRSQVAESAARGVILKLDYFEVFDKETFEPVRGSVGRGRELVIAGAVWVGKTRLIDNLLLGWDM